MKLAQLIQFAHEPVSQGTFTAQFVDEGFGLDERVGGDLGLSKELTPTSRHFLFSEQINTLRLLVRSVLMPHAAGTETSVRLDSLTHVRGERFTLGRVRYRLF